MNKHIKKGIGLFLVLTLIMSSSFSAFAAAETTVEEEYGDLSIVQLDKTSYLMSDGESEAVMNIEAVESGERVSVVQQGKEEYFLIDRENGQIYSSYTGQYTPIAEIIEENEVMKVQDAPSNNARGTGDIVETYTTKVSYRSIAKLIGDSYDAYSLASTIATIILAATGLAIPTLASLVVSAIKSIGVSTIVNKVKNNASGGIKFTIYKCEITKHQGGRIVKGYGYKIGSASLYS